MPVAEGPVAGHPHPAGPCGRHPHRRPRIDHEAKAHDHDGRVAVAVEGVASTSASSRAGSGSAAARSDGRADAASRDAGAGGGRRWSPRLWMRRAVGTGPGLLVRPRGAVVVLRAATRPVAVIGAAVRARAGAQALPVPEAATGPVARVGAAGLVQDVLPDTSGCERETADEPAFPPPRFQLDDLGAGPRRLAPRHVTDGARAARARHVGRRGTAARLGGPARSRGAASSGRSIGTPRDGGLDVGWLGRRAGPLWLGRDATRTTSWTDRAGATACCLASCCCRCCHHDRQRACCDRDGCGGPAWPGTSSPPRGRREAHPSYAVCRESGGRTEQGQDRDERTHGAH